MKNHIEEVSLSFEDIEYCMRIVLNTISEGMMIVSKDGIVLYYNRQMSLIENLEPREIIGKNILSIYEVNKEISEHFIVAKTKNPIIDRYQEYYTKQGNKIFSVASTYPIIKDGKLIATYSISRSVDKITEVLNRTKEIEKQFNLNTESNNNTRYSFNSIITNSEKIYSVLNKAKKFSKYYSNVLIYGETGVGKEIFAQGIHNYNVLTKKQPFVAINCSAIPENLLESILFGTVKGAYTGSENRIGLIEKAGHGTLYLDEINSMPLNLQVKLLRVIQEKKFRCIGGLNEISVNCRIMSSTNIPPETCLREGKIRNDLYYRLSTNVLEIPSLRERKIDIIPLIHHFAKIYGSKYGLLSLKLSDLVIETLKDYNYPGNVRELESIVESAITLSDENQLVDISCLPNKVLSRKNKIVKSNQDLNSFLKDKEKEKLLEELEINNWNISQTARSLQIARQNLQYRMKKLNIKKRKSHSNW